MARYTGAEEKGGVASFTRAPRPHVTHVGVHLRQRRWRRRRRRRPRPRPSADFTRESPARIIASRVGRSRARPPIGAGALGVAARRTRRAATAPTSGDARARDVTIAPIRARVPARKEGANRASRHSLFSFADYTEGIINICYSTYGARAAPFHPTMRPTGRTLNTLSPSLYVHRRIAVQRNRRIAALAIDRERKPLSLLRARSAPLSLPLPLFLSLSSLLSRSRARWRSNDPLLRRASNFAGSTPS